MRTPLALLIAAATLGGCTTDGPLTPPPPEVPDEVGEGAYHLTMDVASGHVTITPPRERADAADGLSQSILGREVIGMEARNGVCTPTGKRVHCTFELAVRNRLEGVTLVTPSSLPAPPAGTNGLIAFPYAAAALGVSGGSAVPSKEWDHDPINMFNDFSGCKGPTSDCYRYEVYPGPLGPEQTSEYRRVGFDVDRNAVAVSAYVAVGAALGSTGTGTSTSRCGSIGKHVEPVSYGLTLGSMNVGQNEALPGMPPTFSRGFCELRVEQFAGRRVAHATLRLYQHDFAATMDPFTAYGPIVVDHVAWQEGAIPAAEEMTQAHREALYEATGIVSLLEEAIGTLTDDAATGVYRSVDVTAAVAADVAAGRAMSQFRIRFAGELDGGFAAEVILATRETAPQEPELIVSYANE